MQRLHPGDPGFVYSYTQLTTYDTCHWNYFLKYIEEPEIEEAGNAFSEYGSLIHELIDLWARGEIAMTDLKDEYIARYADAVVHSFPRMMRGISEKMYDAGIDYFENFDGFPGFDIVGTETKYETEIAGKKFTGIVDMLLRDKFTGQLTILDHKSKSLATFKKEEKTIYRQQYLYSKFIYENYGEWPAVLAFNLFREGGVIKEKPFDAAEYEKVLDWAARIINEIEENDPIGMLQMKEKPDLFCNEICGMRTNCAFGTAKITRKKDT